MDRAYEAYNNCGLRILTLRSREFVFLHTFMSVGGLWVCTGYLWEDEDLLHSQFSPSITYIPGIKHRLFDLIASAFTP